MSGKRNKASGKAGSSSSNQSVKNMQNTKTTQKSKSKAAQKKASKKIFWLSLALCVSAALNIALIIVLAVGNKGNSDLDISDTGTPYVDTMNTDTTNSYTANADTSGADVFSYSDGIDENGFWKGISALDYVELFDYSSFSIPREIHDISDDNVQSEINNLMGSYFPATKQITDRAIVDGDTVNIDYVGSVDGVEFSGGSTGGGGTDVTAGSTDYIDDFLIQIIGHMPGETINVEVTFPDVYDNNPDLAGKDALFVTTINYIVEYNTEVDYDISDGFVEENLYADYGWRTVNEMEEGIRDGLQRTAIENYVREYIDNGITLYSTPDDLMTYQEKLIERQEKDMLDYYQNLADSYEMDLETVLQYFAGVSGTDELIEQNRFSIIDSIKRSLAIQAIAEDTGLSVSEEDLGNYLPDYSSYEGQYGMPWLVQYVLGLKVIDYIIENAVLA